jgi:hypothetical protein
LLWIRPPHARQMSTAISNSKDYCAYPDLIFYYAAPSANHLYVNPRKAGVAISLRSPILSKLDNKYLIYY